jgi:hypothetical protein
MKKKHFITFCSILVTTAFLAGCATIVRGSSETIEITTSPSGAMIKLSTGQSARSPSTFEVARKGTIFVTVTKEGYETVETKLISSIEGASLGIGTAANLLTIPVVNDVVDYQTGANYSHKPNPLHIELTPLKEDTN